MASFRSHHNCLWLLWHFPLYRSEVKATLCIRTITTGITLILIYNECICRVGLVGRCCAKGLICIILIHLNNCFLRYLSRVLIFRCTNWDFKKLSAFLSGPQLGSGIVKIGMPAPEPELAIVMRQKFESTTVLGIGSRSLHFQGPSNLPLCQSQPHALPFRRQDSQPWHLLLLGTFSCSLLCAGRMPSIHMWLQTLP